MNKPLKNSVLKQELQSFGYQVIKYLGTGSFGQVILVTKNEKSYAVKCINKKMINQKNQLNKYVKNEFEVLKSLNHPNILKQDGFFTNDNHIFMLLQYCNMGNLLTYQSKRPKKVFSNNQTMKIISEVLKGLNEIHNKKFIHRDLKPQNILLKYQDGDITFKIGDFGFSRPIQNNIVQTHCGTLNFMAPQILHYKKYGIQADIWAIGVIIYFMMFAQYPFKSLNILTDIQQKCSTGFQISKCLDKKQKLKDITPQLQDFLSRIFVIDSKKRITMRQISQHPLFKGYFIDFKTSSPRSVQSQQSSTEYKQEKKQLQFEIQKIYYLKSQYNCIKQNYKKLLTNVDGSNLIASEFYIMKAIIFYIKRLLASLNQDQNPEQLINNEKWPQFCQSPEIKKQYQRLTELLKESTKEYQRLYTVLHQTNVSLRGFKQSFTVQVNQKNFDDFKFSYRAIIGNLFKLISSNDIINNLKQKIKLRLFCCHMINRVFQQKQIKDNFPGFCNQFNNEFTHRSFISWVDRQSKDCIQKMISNLHKKYLSGK